MDMPVSRCLWSLMGRQQLQLTDNGSFALLPSCPQEMDSDIEHILAVMWSDRVYYIHVKSDRSDQLFIDGDTRHRFGTVCDLIRYLEEGRRVLMLSNGQSVQPLRHCASYCATPPHQIWFHPNIGAAEAKALVAQQPLGSYLVYQTRSVDSPFALCVYGEDETVGCFRIRVRRCADSQRCFVWDEFSFPTVGELIEFYASRSLADDCQRRYRLKTPVPCTAFVARVAKQRVEELLAVDGLKAEFKAVCQASALITCPKSVAQCALNASKNRYQNVLPYDDTRVALSGVQDADGGVGGYINASRIRPDGTDRGSEYIASQGPLETTRGDFWLMVWQEGTRVVIMATKELEGRKRKCQRYWPTRAEGTLEFSVGERQQVLTVRHLDETERRHFSVTRLAVSCSGAGSGSSRTVQLLRYHDWPDHGAPREAASVLELLDQANRANRELSTDTQTPPMVIHCSAGLGRTGCLIAIDSLLQTVQSRGLDAAHIDVYGTVLRMRGQREGMVQNLAQYRFIYAALIVHIDSVLRPLSPAKRSMV